MEDKLAEYRRAKNEQFNKSKKVVLKENQHQARIDSAYSFTNYIPFYHLIGRIMIRISKTETAQSIGSSLSKIPIIGNAYFLYFALWFIMYLFMVECGFGIVYLTSSLIISIFFNLGKRRSGELSAYSVFNPNCQRLDGTFSSDDFERNVLHRH
jgi:hypothetical protein